DITAFTKKKKLKLEEIHGNNRKDFIDNALCNAKTFEDKIENNNLADFVNTFANEYSSSISLADKNLKICGEIKDKILAKSLQNLIISHGGSLISGRSKSKIDIIILGESVSKNEFSKIKKLKKENPQIDEYEIFGFLKFLKDSQ
ncbi:MAG: hypothetical protein MHPSP_002382, partial [Paramarteilia canceri]